MNLSNHIISGNFYYYTDYYHCNNAFTINDYLNNYLPKDAKVLKIEDNYAEILYNNKEYSVWALRDVDGYNHHIVFDQIE